MRGSETSRQPVATRVLIDFPVAAAPAPSSGAADSHPQPTSRARQPPRRFAPVPSPPARVPLGSALALAGPIDRLAHPRPRRVVVDRLLIEEADSHPGLHHPQAQPPV